MPLDIPLPTASPDDDPAQYVPLLLSAIEGFLLARDVWAADDFDEARQYMNVLMAYVVDLMGDGIVYRVPIGATMVWWSDTIPAGWLKMSGQGLSKTTYPELFAIFGYSAGGAFDTFVLPTMRGFLPIGADAGVDLLENAGAETVTLSTGHLPAHSHSVTDPGHAHRIINRSGVATNRHSGVAGANASNAEPVASTTNSAIQNLTTSVTTGITLGDTGSGTPFSILPPVKGAHWIIYAGG
jgi:microcystin-dependent protein